MNKKYTLTTSKRIGGQRGSYRVIILSEFSLPNELGEFMRAKVVANFGNADNKDNWNNARIVKAYFESL